MTRPCWNATPRTPQPATAISRSSRSDEPGRRHARYRIGQVHETLAASWKTILFGGRTGQWHHWYRCNIRQKYPITSISIVLSVIYNWTLTTSDERGLRLNLFFIKLFAPGTDCQAFSITIIETNCTRVPWAPTLYLRFPFVHFSYQLHTILSSNFYWV